jgi:hypothetical protein
VITLAETYPTSRTTMFVTTVRTSRTLNILRPSLIHLEADNYSWFYLYYWFAKQWPDNWKDSSVENDVANSDKPSTPENYKVASESFPVGEDAIDTDKLAAWLPHSGYQGFGRQ